MNRLAGSQALYLFSHESNKTEELKKHVWNADNHGTHARNKFRADAFEDIKKLNDMHRESTFKEAKRYPFEIKFLWILSLLNGVSLSLPFVQKFLPSYLVSQLIENHKNSVIAAGFVSGLVFLCALKQHFKHKSDVKTVEEFETFFLN